MCALITTCNIRFLARSTGFLATVLYVRHRLGGTSRCTAEVDHTMLPAQGECLKSTKLKTLRRLLFGPPTHRARHHLELTQKFGDATFNACHIDVVQVRHPFLYKRCRWNARYCRGCVRRQLWVDRNYN